MVVAAFSARKVSISFSALYGSHFLFLGLLLPFFSGWLALKGFSAIDIGLINGVALVARLLVGPLVAVFADRGEDKRKPLQAVSILFALAGLGILLSDNLIITAVSSVIVIWCFGVLVPLTDSMVLRADRSGLIEYGKVRAVGSVMFLLTTILGGMLLDVFGMVAVGQGIAFSCFAALAIALMLPAQSSATEGRQSGLQWREAGRLVMTPIFILALFAAAMTQGAHAVYYAYSILHWTEIGYSASLIGWLWAIGVIAEILLLTKARKLVKKFGVSVLLTIGAGAAALRWSFTAMEPPLFLLFMVQMLHALTFAATYIGSVEFIDQALPSRFVNTGMTLFSTTGVGAMTGLATLIAGFVFQASGASIAYYMMAGMGVFSLLLVFCLRRVWDGEKIIA